MNPMRDSGFGKDDWDAQDAARIAISQLPALESWLFAYLRVDRRQDPLFRLGIANYELGDLTKKIVYKEAGLHWNAADAEVALGEAVLNIMITGKSVGLNVTRGMELALQKLIDVEHRQKDKADALCRTVESVEGECAPTESFSKIMEGTG